MNRQNSGDFKDGVGGYSVSVGADFDETIELSAFSTGLLTLLLVFLAKLLIAAYG